MMDKKRVIVIFGGVSVEHDVSIITAHQVMKAIDITRYEVIPVYISLQGKWHSDDLLKDKEIFKKKGDIKELPDVWITPFRDDLFIYKEKKVLAGKFKKREKIPFDIAFPLVHGSNGEDGTLQGLFELKNIPFVGSGSLSSAICMNKYLTKQVIHHNSIDVLPCTYIESHEWFREESEIIALIEEEFEYPVIVKPNSLGSSIGVRSASSRDELCTAIDSVFKIDTGLIIEPMLTDMIEINCAILDGEKRVISKTEQPLSSGIFLDFETKYKKGGKGKKSGIAEEASRQSRGLEDTPRIIPAPVDQEIIDKVEEYSETAFHVLGCSGVARVDFLFDLNGGKLYLNELNTIPGSLAYYLFKDIDIDFTELTTRLLENAERVYGIRNQRTFDFKSGLF